MSDSGGIEKLIRPHLKCFTGYSASISQDRLKGKVDVSLEDIIKINAIHFYVLLR